jgi:hypothetical protein
MKDELGLVGIGKVKIKLSLCLTKYHTMKTYLLLSVRNGTLVGRHRLLPNQSIIAIAFAWRD